MATPPTVLNTIIAALRALNEPALNAALANKNAGAIADWLNANSTTLAWRDEVTKRDLFEAMKIATYDAVSAGKKESWRLMLELAPIDFTRQKMRKGILDIFEVSDANAMLADFTQFATRAEEIMGGTSATTGTVTAIKRNFVGNIGSRELGAALK